MEKFEVHITGDHSIHYIAEKKLGKLKTIQVNLLTPDYKIFRIEHMTSLRFGFKNFDDCKLHVDRLAGLFLEHGVRIDRVKIECPFYKHYVDQSLYIESHFKATDNHFPLSINAKKPADAFLGTNRTYDKSLYDEFISEIIPGSELELCVFDSNITQDKDWFDLYAN